MLDCLIIGAGPAGLTAATYLARFRRRILLLDAGSPRAALIPTTHNFPGFPKGVSGEELLALLREQASVHGVEVTEARVDSIERRPDGFSACAGDRSWDARNVILATGVRETNIPISPGFVMQRSPVSCAGVRSAMDSKSPTRRSRFLRLPDRAWDMHCFCALSAST